jgi:hypothetical protein
MGFNQLKNPIMAIVLVLPMLGRDGNGKRKIGALTEIRLCKDAKITATAGDHTQNMLNKTRQNEMKRNGEMTRIEHTFFRPPFGSCTSMYIKK